MTIVEAHRMFDIYLDKISSEAYPEVSSLEKDIFLRNATNKFVKTRYGKNNIYQAGFEEIQKRTDDLRTLVVTGFPEVSEYSYADNTYVIDLTKIYTDDEDKTIDTLSSDLYWFFLKGEALRIDPTCGSNYIECKLVQQDDLIRTLKDPFNSPSKYRAIMYFEGGNIFVKCAKDNTISNFKLTFLKQPAQVNVGTYGGQVVEFDLPDHTHEEVVKLAVQEAIETIESQRIQTFNTNTIE